ncbi:hypothetical protein [Caulobacter mirabilis]|uniref:hypothetical protein n=1 Tax=Caulobacter mirabilis TaxID=69666 RepID=UPI0012371278|nr:hypothetical protein [Caulobacter mirabilis]
MKHVLIGVVLTGVMGVQSAIAETAWSGDFLAICGASRNDFRGAIEKAKALGYAEVPVPNPGKMTYAVQMFRETKDGRPLRLIVAESMETVGTKRWKFSNCALGTRPTVSDWTAIASWAGVAPDKTGPTKANYVFHEKGGRFVSLAGASEADFQKAAATSRVWMLEILTEDDLTDATLSYGAPVL